MTKQAAGTLKGFRDFLPETLLVRTHVKNILREAFLKYGFDEIETPTLEYAETLMGKYGEEADKLVYSFFDQGERKVGMRYDLTVPTAKVLALNPNLPKPFKRYQMQYVWRADKPQKGRYREILQCDIDTFGSSSPYSDAEMVAVIFEILQKLKFSKYSIHINSRTVLKTILEKAGISENQNSVLQSLDKFVKIGKEGVGEELAKKGLSSQNINNIFSSLDSAEPDEYLKQVFAIVEKLGVAKDAFMFDPTMVRGLDYYTGPIFETYVEEPKIGSITGGGRYDNLVKLLGGPDIPAVGTTIGLDRIVDCILELGLMPNFQKTAADVMVANFGEATMDKSLEVANRLRSSGINVMFYPSSEKLGKQFKYASDRGIPYVAVVGEEELKNNVITVKNMQSTEQKSVKVEELVKELGY